MKTVILADPTCGMNKQIVQLLNILSRETIEIGEGHLLQTQFYGICREMGFVLSFYANGNYKNMVFYEHRNSDQICCIVWDGFPDISGVIRPSDIPKDVFPDKWTYIKSWGYGSFEEVVNYIKEILNSWIDQDKENQLIEKENVYE